MWYPASVTVAPAVEPVTLAQAKAQCGITDGSRDTQVQQWIGAARRHVEKYCSIRLTTQTVTVPCDGFSDLQRLPVAPIQSIATVSYVDTAGSPQVLAETVYELRRDGLEPSVVLKHNQYWPAILPGSRITTTAVAGYGLAAEVPEDIVLAILLVIGQASSLSRADLLLRSETVEGIGAKQFGGIVEVGGVVDRTVATLLSDYRRWPLT